MAMADATDDGHQSALRKRIRHRELRLCLECQSAIWHACHTIAAAWQFTGYVMALYLAGLRGISNELREAAAIDGAGTWATYRHRDHPVADAGHLYGARADGHELDSRVRPGHDAAADPHSPRIRWASICSRQPSANIASRMGATIGFFMIFLSTFLVVPYLRSMRQEVER